MLVSVAHTKGGVGKTTTAFNLAIGLNANTLYDLDTINSISALAPLRSEQDKTNKLNIVTAPTKDDLIKLIQEDDDDQLHIIDTGGFDLDINRLVIAYSDLVITPVSDTGLESVGLKSFSNTLKQIEQDTETPIKSHVLLNKIHHSKKNFEDLHRFIGSMSCYNVFNTVIRKKREIEISSGKCLSVHEYKPYSDAARNFNEFFTEVKATLKLIREG